MSTPKNFTKEPTEFHNSFKAPENASFYNTFRSTSNNKFDHSKHKRSTTISEGNFFNWTSDHMYRTSYNDMSKRVSFILIIL